MIRIGTSLLAFTAGEYFHNQAQNADARKSPARDEAKKWLLDTLHNGPRWADDVWEIAKQSGFSERTIKRAKEEAGIVSERAGFGRHGKSYWRLPEQFGKIPDYLEDTPLNPLVGTLWLNGTLCVFSEISHTVPSAISEQAGLLWRKRGDGL